MRSEGTIVALVACLAGGCGDDGGAGDGGGTGSAELSGVVWTEGGIVGWPLDRDPPSPILVELVERPDAFAADGSGVWMAYGDGELYGAAADGTGLIGPFDVASENGVGPDHMALRDGEVWFVGTGSETGPAYYDIAADSVVESGALPDGFGDQYDGLAIDGGDVYVLLGNGFALLKFDAGSQTLSASALLGQDPSDPTGPRGEFFGTGVLAVGEDNVWVFDTSVNKLHKIEKSDLSISDTVDLSADVPDASDAGTIELKVGDQNVYVVNRNNGDDNADFFAIDKSSLEATTLRSTGEILAGVTNNGDLLLYEDQPSGAVILDGTTGDEVGTVSLVLDGEPTIWVP